MDAEVFLRDSLEQSDREEVIRLCRLAGNFSVEEITIAEELVSESLDKGPASGYHFLFAQEREKVRGYVCYGPIPGTDSGWDIYWLVVDPAVQKLGLGAMLLREAELDAAQRGGTRVYVDTSSNPDYQPARSFYRSQGYSLGAELKDFYRPGDNKVIFAKDLTVVSGS